MSGITQQFAERTAKAHACPLCGERNYKRVRVKSSSPSHRADLHVAWQARMSCGVCGADFELGIAADGDIVYEG